MSETEIRNYRKCANCGKYCPEFLMINKMFCSEECAALYGKCRNCGKYFPLESGYDKDFCSAPCHDNFTYIKEEEV